MAVSIRKMSNLPQKTLAKGLRDAVFHWIMRYSTRIPEWWRAYHPMDLLGERHLQHPWHPIRNHQVRKRLSDSLNWSVDSLLQEWKRISCYHSRILLVLRWRPRTSSILWDPFNFSFRLKFVVYSYRFRGNPYREQQAFVFTAKNQNQASDWVQAIRATLKGVPLTGILQSFWTAKESSQNTANSLRSVH